MTDMKTQPFQMRASPEWLAKIDDWRTKRRPELSRAEAIRQLVDRALTEKISNDSFRSWFWHCFWRSEVGSVGKGWVGTVRCRWLRYIKKKIHNMNKKRML